MTPVTDAYTWHGRDLLGSDGEKIGSVKEIYQDERTGKPEWALVTTGLFGSHSHFVPLAGAEPTGEGVRVRVSKDQVKNSPSISEGELSKQEERQLFEHYGVPYTDEGSVTAEGAPRSDPGDGGAGHDAGGPSTDGAMTRSEEVRKERVETEGQNPR